MTAATPPPPRDGEVRDLMGDLKRSLGLPDRPAAPSEPAAADSPTPGTETFGREHASMGHAVAYAMEQNARRAAEPLPAAPSPVVTAEPPAEAPQDDEVEAAARAVAEVWSASGGAPLAASDIALARRMARAALAARPSADTETLRRVREVLVTWNETARRRRALAEKFREQGRWQLADSFVQLARQADTYGARLRAALDAR